MYIHTYVLTHMHAYVYIYINVYVCVHGYFHVHVRVHAHVNEYVTLVSCVIATEAPHLSSTYMNHTVVDLSERRVDYGDLSESNIARSGPCKVSWLSFQEQA